MVPTRWTLPVFKASLNLATRFNSVPVSTLRDPTQLQPPPDLLTPKEERSLGVGPNLLTHLRTLIEHEQVAVYVPATEAEQRTFLAQVAQSTDFLEAQWLPDDHCYWCPVLRSARVLARPTGFWIQRDHLKLRRLRPYDEVICAAWYADHVRGHVGPTARLSTFRESRGYTLSYLERLATDSERDSVWKDGYCPQCCRSYHLKSVNQQWRVFCPECGDTHLHVVVSPPTCDAEYRQYQRCREMAERAGETFPDYAQP